MYCVEPLNFYGEGEYNLNVVKEVEVTDAFLNLDESRRECQNSYDFQECTTQNNIKAMITKCSCLPFTILGQVKNKICTIAIQFM